MVFLNTSQFNTGLDFLIREKEVEYSSSLSTLIMHSIQGLKLSFLQKKNNKDL